MASPVSWPAKRAAIEPSQAATFNFWLSKHELKEVQLSACITLRLHDGHPFGMSWMQAGPLESALSAFAHTPMNQKVDHTKAKQIPRPGRTFDPFG